MADDFGIFKENPNGVVIPVRLPRLCEDAQDAVLALWCDPQLCDQVGEAAVRLVEYAASFQGSSCDLGSWSWSHAARIAGIWHAAELVNARDALAWAFPAVNWFEPLAFALALPEGLAMRAMPPGRRAKETPSELMRARSFWAAHAVEGRR